MTRTSQAAVPPLQYQEPITVVSEPDRGRMQRFRLSPDFYVTVFDDGRVAVTSLTHDVVVTSINNFETGSGAELTLTRKAPRTFGPGPREADVPVEP